MKVVIVFSLFMALALAGQMQLIQELATFQEAVKHCKSLGANTQLYLPRSDRENKALYRMMQKKHLRRIWINVHLPNGKEPWIDGFGNPPDKLFWGIEEPNNHLEHDEFCGEMRYLDKTDELHNWNDRPCNDLNVFVCEDIE